MTRLFVGHAVLAHAGERSARAWERLPSAVPWLCLRTLR